MLGLIFVLILVTVIVSLAAYLFARRHVALPIERLSHTLIEVAETRDLTISLPVSSRDEIGQSANNVNLLLNNFHQSISEVSNVISGITESVSDLGQSSDEADKVVNELAETIDMLIDAIQQLESQILHSSSVSESAANTAEMGAEQVNDGAREVEQTSESIGKLASDLETTAEMLMELRSSGDQVSSVVGSIAEIADQTNLLALNAAIEAARAGESGRGFAVVADEVRSLANKTQQSTVEINDILDKIVSAINQSLDTMAQNQRQAQNSVNLAQNTVESLASIRNTIMQLSGECHEVSSLSSAAQNEMNQAAKAVNDFKSMGSRVSISSNDVQLAATNLTELAESLSQQALRFKL
jgi:methyl-accepting chemotaxis protein